MSYTMYTPLNVWLDPASITDVVAYIQTYLSENTIYSETEIETIIHDYLIAHPELIGGVQSVNGKTGTVVLSASDINTENNVTIESVLASLSSQISTIAANVATNTTNITNLTVRVSTAETDISNLKSNLNDVTGASVITGWTEGAYIKTNVSIGSTVNLTPTTLAGYRFVVLDCEEGDIFTITVAGASTPRAWAFVDTDNILLTNSNSMAQPRGVILVAPAGSKKLILNDVPSDGVFSSVSYRGVPIRMRADAIENEVIQMQSVGKVVLPFKNQILSNLTAGNLQYNTKTLATNRIHLYGEYSIDIPDDYEVYVATFWKGWDALPSNTAYSTGWKSTHIGILANPDDLYVVEIRRKDNADISISEAENISIKKIVYDCAELSIKNWKQGTTDEEGNIVVTESRVSSADILGFPYRGTFTVKLTSGYALGIRSGARSIDMPSNMFWLIDGDQYTVPDGHNYFRVIVAKDRGTNNPTAAITPGEAGKIECALRYAKSPSVMAGNDSAVKTLDAASLIFNTSGTNGKRAVIAHTSDVHGDAVRLARFADFCDAYGVDYAAMTGDFVAYNVEDGSNYLQNIIANHKSKFGICVGNHDVRGIITDAEVYNYLMSPNADKIGNTTGKNYYYIDLAKQKLRMLSVSLYEEGIVESGNRRNADQHMSSEQLAWLCATLKSTPAGYGIMIMMHTIQAATPIDLGYEDFYQIPLKYSNAGNTALGGAPVFDIVDAFVSRTTVNKSYNQTGTPSPISVSDDFSAVDSSVEFIAFMVGHWHEDAIAYTSTTINKLLVLNVTCTNAIYGGDAYPYLADISDLHRNGRAQSQDAFNAYAIDRDGKIIHVIRIGADTTYEMKKRQYMAIPYIVT